MGQILISASTGALGYYYITEVHIYDMENPMIAAAIFGFLGCLVGNAFLGILALASDAIVLIFTMDEEIQRYH